MVATVPHLESVTASSRGRVVTDRSGAEGYVGRVCFKTGPPRRLGIELEWTVHHTEDPSRPLDPAALAAALGDHAPRTLRPDSPHLALPRGGTVTVEPGGQVEISTPPESSLSRLHAGTASDIDYVADRLAGAGLRLGDHGCDPHRPARRVLHTPRYAAMERAFDRIGPHGRSWMSGSAGLQVCLDAGTTDRVAARWTALHRLGPVLVALFANSPRQAGRDTGWASSRVRTWFDTDPSRTHPPPPGDGEAGSWAGRILDTPVLFVREGEDMHDPPAPVTFAGWIAGAPGAPDRPPTYDDLDYHLSTLFTPVRARGYLEVRYLDAQPSGDWFTPVAVLAALFAREETVDEASERALPAADRWVAAARDGLADPVIGAVAPRVVELARKSLADTDLTAAQAGAVDDRLQEAAQ
ncbi:glutamate-cysteine ligase family protein [Phytohabitans flavus]|uniref:glutamate-cysteine ligase family protein n=1 Tax=Phytohabitans flavus TaxID=1076124 RepID=UPI003CD07FA5